MAVKKDGVVIVAMSTLTEKSHCCVLARSSETTAPLTRFGTKTTGVKMC